LNGLIGQSYQLLLSQNGSNSVAGTGSWAGYGIVALSDTNDFRYVQFLISGGYNGGSSGKPFPPLDPSLVSSFSDFANRFLLTIDGLDPVRMVDGAFHLDSTDLSLGQREPRGITFSRHYSPTRRHHSLAKMANGWVHNYSFNLAEVSAPLPGLGTTTPAQMAPMLVATRAALALYQMQPDPKLKGVVKGVGKGSGLTNGVFSKLKGKKVNKKVSGVGQWYCHISAGGAGCGMARKLRVEYPGAIYHLYPGAVYP
jgi:hypothetical protein